VGVAEGDGYDDDSDDANGGHDVRLMGELCPRVTNGTIGATFLAKSIETKNYEYI